MIILSLEVSVHFSWCCCFCSPDLVWKSVHCKSLNPGFLKVKSYFNRSNFFQIFGFLDLGQDCNAWIICKKNQFFQIVKSQMFNYVWLCWYIGIYKLFRFWLKLTILWLLYQLDSGLTIWVPENFKKRVFQALAHSGTKDTFTDMPFSLTRQPGRL